MKMDRFIKEKAEVEEAELKRSYGKSEKREDYPAGWKKTGNVVLLGLPGSGKALLAKLVSEKTGQKVVAPQTWEDAQKSLEGDNVIVILDDKLVDSPEKGPVVQGAGKVFFLMVDAQTVANRLAARDPGLDQETVWKEMGERLETAQPMFFAMLHFVLQGVRPADQLLGDVMEKLAY